MRLILFHKINNISRIKHRNSSAFDIITQQPLHYSSKPVTKQ